MAGLGRVIANLVPLSFAGRRTSRIAKMGFEFAIGATGAVGASTNSPGDVALTRTGVGAYTLALPSCKYVSGVNIRVEGNTPTLAADRRAVSVGVVDATGGELSFLCLVIAGSGTGSELTAGSKIHFDLTMDYT